MVPQTPANNYQEEMCERLIQLSFAKIVNSKNERGGARLRKNLLILHLLQKARTEQRTRLYVVTPTPMDEEEKTSSTNDDDVDNDNSPSLRRNNDEENNFKSNDDEQNNNNAKNSIENFDDDFIPLSPFVQAMKIDLNDDDSQGTQKQIDSSVCDKSNEYCCEDVEISSTTTTTTNNNNSLKKCANSSDEDESSSDTDDSDSACSDDDVSSPPCVRCKRKRKLTEGSDANGDTSSSSSSNKRTCSLSASTQQLQGLITVFKNGLSSMNGDVEASSTNGSTEINIGDSSSSSSDDSQSYVVGSRQQNNLNRTLSCPAIWELTCAS